MQAVDASRTNTSDLLSRLTAQGAKKPATLQTADPKFSTLVSQILTRRQAAAKQKDVEDLMADLDNDERDFAEEPSRDRFEAYRKTVKALMSMLVSRGYRLQGWEDKKRRRYEIVKVIDARLAQIYSGLMRRNQDVIIALHLMGQIRGLIFDLKA